MTSCAFQRPDLMAFATYTHAGQIVIRSQRAFGDSFVTFGALKPLVQMDLMGKSHTIFHRRYSSDCFAVDDLRLLVFMTVPTYLTFGKIIIQGADAMGNLLMTYFTFYFCCDMGLVGECYLRSCDLTLTKYGACG